MGLPEFGTAPIRCAKRGCKWRGYETDMGSRMETRPSGMKQSKAICPVCGNDDYYFLTAKEIAAWERQKTKQNEPNKA